MRATTSSRTPRTSTVVAGRYRLLENLRLGAEVRVLRAPCMGACDRAPVVAINHGQAFYATPEKIAAAAIEGFISGDHGDLMVFFSDQIKVQPRAA